MLNQFSSGTVKTYIPFIHKFWIYTLYFPPKSNESFMEYLWNYRTVLATKGFSIIKKETVQQVSFERKAYSFKKTESVKADMVAIKSYFTYIYSETNNESFELIEKIPFGIYRHSINYKKIDQKAKYNIGSSYGLKARGMMRKALAENITVFDKLISSRQHISKKNSLEKSLGVDYNGLTATISMKNFPLAMFDDFIDSIKNPRDKLLYLFCAACGARVSQALNLTIYDVDCKNEKVYLVDPLTENKPIDCNNIVFMEQKGRKTLLEQYGISASISPHNLIRFKYPIPVNEEFNRELMFLPGSFKTKFFQTYIEVLNTINTRNSPFVFQTRTGKRYLPSNAYDIFRNNLEKFKLNYPHFRKINILEGIHCFRHMNGVVWADIAHYLDEILRLNALEKKEKIPNTIEIIKTLVSRKLGITSDSINVYFNRSEYTRNQVELLAEKFGNNMMKIFNLAKESSK